MPVGVPADTWLAAIVESSDDAIVSKDLSGIVSSWNRSAERLFGYTAAEMVGRPIAAIAAPGREDEMPRILDRIRQGEPVDHYETVRRAKDGRLVEVSLTISPIRDASGRIVGASKIARDITERKAAEAALRASEERFRQLANRVPVLVWFATSGGEVRFFNERWYAFTGLTPDESLGLGWIEAVHPEDRERVHGSWLDAFGQSRSFEAEHRCRGRDGTYRWFLTRAEPLQDESGRITGWFGTSTDIQDRKRAEQYQRLLMAEVDHRVKNILATIQSVARQTLPAGKSVGSFNGRLAALAHTHDLLARHRWEGVNLEAIVRAELAPYLGRADRGRVTIDGPEITLVPKLAQMLTMGLHELATNAAKYGALSTPEGQVRISWSREAGTDAEQLRILWQESHGPRVRPARRQGFGRALIERGIAYELHGQARLEFLEEGVRCTIVVPLAPEAGPPAGLPLEGDEAVC